MMEFTLNLNSVDLPNLGFLLEYNFSLSNLYRDQPTLLQPQDLPKI